MAERWPRNIVPLDDETVRLLAEEGVLDLYLAALDAPVPMHEITRILRRPALEAEGLADRMVARGLLIVEHGAYAAGHRHIREEDFDVPGRTAFRLAILNRVQSALDEFRAAIHAKGEAARAGLSSVELSADPETMLRAIAILAETEDQLRALQDEHPPQDAESRIRVVFMIGSTMDAR